MDLLINNIQNIKLDDSNKWLVEDALDSYLKYINNLNKLDQSALKYFLMNVKMRELKNNQETEQEPSFLIGLYILSQKQNSIDLTVNLLKKGFLTRDDIELIHGCVIAGSTDDKIENYPFRTDNNKWVGSFLANGERVIDYMPPDYNDIESLLEIILDYVNEKTNDPNDIFIKSFVIHGLIGYLQPFGNGNTRLARVVQHGEIMAKTNEILKTEFIKPILYLSENYLKTRPQYRNLVKQL